MAGRKKHYEVHPRHGGFVVVMCDAHSVATDEGDWEDVPDWPTLDDETMAWRVANLLRDQEVRDRRIKRLKTLVSRMQSHLMLAENFVQGPFRDRLRALQARVIQIMALLEKS